MYARACTNARARAHMRAKRHINTHTHIHTHMGTSGSQLQTQVYGVVCQQECLCLFVCVRVHARRVRVCILPTQEQELMYVASTCGSGMCIHRHIHTPCMRLSSRFSVSSVRNTASDSASALLVVAARTWACGHTHTHRHRVHTYSKGAQLAHMHGFAQALRCLWPNTIAIQWSRFEQARARS